MESLHELRAFKALSRIASGVYLYEAPVVREGESNTEPVDAFWHVDDMLLVVFCTEKTAVNPTQQRAARKWHEGVEHNLKQAKGWLRAWRSGQSLHGRNRCGTIEVPYSSEIAVAVLSVVDSPMSHVHSHADFAEREKVTAAISVPAACLEHMGIHSFTLYDMASIIRQCSWQAIHGMSTGMFCDLVGGLYAGACAEAPSVTVKNPDDARKIQRLLLWLKYPSPLSENGDVHPDLRGGHVKFLVDSPLADVLRLKAAMDHLALLHANQVGGSIFVTGLVYDFLVGSFVPDKIDNATAQITSVNEAFRAGLVKPGVNISIDPGGFMNLVACRGQVTKLQTSRVLRGIPIQTGASVLASLPSGFTETDLSRPYSGLPPAMS